MTDPVPVDDCSSIDHLPGGQRQHAPADVAPELYDTTVSTESTTEY